MADALITKTLKAGGRVVEVKATDRAGFAAVYIDGALYGTGRVGQLVKRQGDYTHCVRTEGSILPLTESEARVVRGAIGEVKLGGRIRRECECASCANGGACTNC